MLVRFALKPKVNMIAKFYNCAFAKLLYCFVIDLLIANTRTLFVCGI